MKAAGAIFLVCLLSAPLAFAQSSDKSEQQEKKRSSRSTKGTETRKQDTKSQTTRDTLTVSNEIGVGALFFPLLKYAEDRKEYALNLSNGEARPCTVFSSRYVYHDVEGAMVNTTMDDQGRKSMLFKEAAVMNVNVTDPWIVFDQSVEIFGEAERANVRLACLSMYAHEVDRAARILLTKYQAQTAKNAYGDPVYLIPNLQEAARQAIFGAGNGSADSQSLNYRGACTVPTANGLQQGVNDVRCGEWSFKSQGGNPTLEKSGVKWLAQDYVQGRKVLFAEGRSVEAGTTRQTSDSASTTREQSKERSTSQGATIVKPSR